MLNDGCTAWILSDWLNSTPIRMCCDVHDRTLDHTYDLGTFFWANVDWIGCVASTNSLVAVVGGAFIAGPVGWLLYQFGPKRKNNDG